MSQNIETWVLIVFICSGLECWILVTGILTFPCFKFLVTIFSLPLLSYLNEKASLVIIFMWRSWNHTHLFFQGFGLSRFSQAFYSLRPSIQTKWICINEVICTWGLPPQYSTLYMSACWKLVLIHAEFWQALLILIYLQAKDLRILCSIIFRQVFKVEHCGNPERNGLSCTKSKHSVYW